MDGYQLLAGEPSPRFTGWLDTYSDGRQPAGATTRLEWSAWWSAWALIGWRLAVAAHGLVVPLSRPASLSLVREEKQIEKVLASMGPESHR